MIREPKGIGSEVKDESDDPWTLGPEGWTWNYANPVNSVYRNWTWEKLVRQEGVKEVIVEVSPPEKTFTKEEILEALKNNPDAAADLVDALGIEIPTKKVRYVVDFELEPGEDVEDYLNEDMFFDIWFAKVNTKVISAEVVND